MRQFKNVEIILEESEAVLANSLYIIPIGNGKARGIVTDSNGTKVSFGDVVPDNISLIDYIAQGGVEILGNTYTKEQIHELLTSNSGYKGEAGLNTVPESEGVWWYKATESGVYNFFFDSSVNKIEVTAEDLSILNGVQENEVVLEVRDGVASKRVYAKRGIQGLKGDPFTYEDFTPENILEFKQPAIEAAEVANEAADAANLSALNANNAADRVDEAIESADLATQNANNAASNVTDSLQDVDNALLSVNQAVLNSNSATQSANEAAQSANTAATNADTKAGLAESAATNANTKANLADVATSNANTAANLANQKAGVADTAAQGANLAKTAAETAAGNANDKATIAQSAASNANEAAQSANTAAGNANTAAGNANSAATAANTAATNANNAATNANSQRGWQPLIVSDATTISGKVLNKLADWIGGTGTKPTDYVGQWQTAAGGYTNVAANAMDVLSMIPSGGADVSNLTWANKNLNVFTLTGRYYFMANGVLTPNASYNATPLYRVKEGMKFNNPFMGEGAVAQAAFFKSDNTFLSAVQGQSEITAPAGAFFVGFSRSATSNESIKVQSDFWAMQQDNMVVRYVQAGNKEVTVTSNTGNVLNAVGHGFVNGDRVILSLVSTPTNNEIASIIGRVPILGTIPVSTGNGDVGYYVVNATTDTFQLSATAGGTALSVNANPNFTAFKFEKVAAASLIFNGLPASNNYKILISGGCYRLPRYVHPNSTSSNGAKVNTTGTAISSGGLQMNTSAVVTDAVITIASGKSGFFLTQEYKSLTTDATGNLITAIVNDTIFHFSDKRDITQIELTAIGLSNGSVIKIIRE